MIDINVFIFRDLDNDFFLYIFIIKVVESGNFDLHLRSKGTKQDESTTRRVRM